MAFVLDTSVAGAWFLPDEFSEIADQLLDNISTSPPAVPSLFRHELRNLLLIAERRDRVTSFQVDEALMLLATLPIIDHGAGADQDILNLARKHRLTGYDAAYLALAFSEGLPLATFDKRLAAAARAENIAVLDATSAP